jgi:DNA-binding NarL/FixJ family response regulator
MPEARPLTAIVCDPDPFTRASTALLARIAGFDVLAEIAYAVDAAHNTEMARPSLVLILHEQSGFSGLDAIPEIRAAVPDAPPEVVLLTSDASVRDRALERGAFAIAIRTEPEMIERVLGEARHLIETGERRMASDRRSGDDRRVVQDWSRVTQERRNGDDRRKGYRREDDVTHKAREILEGQRTSY